MTANGRATLIGRPAAAALGLAVVLAIVGFSGTASARSNTVVSYRFGQIWSTAIRLLRVDRGYEVSDHDRENGYVLFTFPGSGAIKKCPASLEIVPITDDDGAKRNRIQLSIAHQPRYIEVNLLEALEHKLKQEQGEPPKPARPKRPKGGDKPSDKKSPDGDANP